MKKMLIFCVSLNVALAAGLGFVFYLGKREMKEIDKAEEMRAQSVRSESVDLLEKAAFFFAEKDYLNSRLSLKMVQYSIYGLENPENAKLIGKGDWYFFESDIPDASNYESEFYGFVGAVRNILQGGRLNPEEEAVLDKIRIAHDNSAFSQTVYPSLNSTAEVAEEVAYKKAKRLLGDQVVLQKCEDSLFPLSYNYSGTNTFASISKLGGRIIKLYFYPGESNYDIDEETAIDNMRNFMRRERIPELQLDNVYKKSGVYYAEFSYAQNKNASLIMGVKGSGGRVCLFDAENFYKYY